MIEYRPFQNSDPPQLVKLWRSCQLGRGAADYFSTDALESLVFSQPYFDRNGLIVACSENEIVGFVHAGFGPNEEQTTLSHDIGIVCMVMVAPSFRRQGVGRKLIERSEAYLRENGAKSIQAGMADPMDPFYHGLYGGSRPAGVLESDSGAVLFFEAIGYQPGIKQLIFQRSFSPDADPVNFQIINLRRKVELVTGTDLDKPTWWWSTRYGRFDTIQFQLKLKEDKRPIAKVTVVGLDFYLPKWQERAIGFLQLEVDEDHRQQGYGQLLLLEVIRHLREEMITLGEVHAPDADPIICSTLQRAGFATVDTGVIYHRSE